MWTGKFESNIVSIGGLIKLSFSLRKAFSQSGDHSNFLSFLVSSTSGRAIWEKEGINLQNQEHKAGKDCIALTLAGRGMSCTQRSLAGSGKIPFVETMKPRILSSENPYNVLEGLAMRLLARNRLNNSLTCWRWSGNVLLYTVKSSTWDKRTKVTCTACLERLPVEGNTKRRAQLGFPSVNARFGLFLHCISLL
jgi:hypothetical protein